MLYEHKFILSLFLTLLIEIPVVIILAKYFFKLNSSTFFKIAFASLIASALTLPYFWFVLPYFIFDRTSYLIIGEVLVILVEAILYKQLLGTNITKAALISLVANIFSIIFGLFLF